MVLSLDEQDELITQIHKVYAACAHHSMYNKLLDNHQLGIATALCNTLKSIGENLQSGNYDPRIVGPTRDLVSVVQQFVTLWDVGAEGR